MHERTNLTHFFAMFRCPRCGHFQRHASILWKGWHTYNWCGACSSYFRVKNELFVLMVWGVIFFAFSYGLFWLAMILSDDRWNDGVAMIVAEILGGVVSILVARRLFPFQFEYVGKDAPP